MNLANAAVILHLTIRVKREHHEAFRLYIHEAFPVFERQGGCKGVVYANSTDPELFDEVFYYDSEASYEASERATCEDPIEIALLARWRALLDGPPRVTVHRPWPADGRGA